MFLQICCVTAPVITDCLRSIEALLKLGETHHLTSSQQMFNKAFFQSGSREMVYR